MHQPNQEWSESQCPSQRKATRTCIQSTKKQKCWCMQKQLNSALISSVWTRQCQSQTAQFTIYEFIYRPFQVNNIKREKGTEKNIRCKIKKASKICSNFSSPMQSKDGLIASFTTQITVITLWLAATIM